MKKAQVGDLVCMGRRKKKGMGIIMEYCPDVTRRTGVVIDTYLKHDRAEKYRHYARIIEGSDPHDRELVRSFLHNNNDTCYKRFKNQFALVKWMKRPSYYESSSVSESEGWYPVEWLSRVC